MINVLPSFTRRTSSIKFIVLLALSSFLSGCFWAPGMHMRGIKRTPTLNNKREIVTPEIVPITAELIKQQREQAERDTAEAIKHYQKPDGFTSNTEGYHYLVGPQDVLSVTVWDHPNLSNPTNTAARTHQEGFGITVDHNGYIYYPYVGYIKVAGHTMNEIREMLSVRLAKYLKDPQLNVRVISFNSQKASVTGAVHAPRVISLTNTPLTVLNAITQAGGPIRCGIQTAAAGSGTNLCADLKSVVLTKADGRKTVIDVNGLRAVDGSSINWVLENKDVLHVPSNNMYRVFILGAVTSPGPYNMTDGHMTLKEALGDARGVTVFANAAYTYIVRNFNHHPEIYAMDIESPDAFNLAGDFQLQPEDVVFVSSSRIETFNAVLKLILPTLTTAVNTKALLQ